MKGAETPQNECARCGKLHFLHTPCSKVVDEVIGMILKSVKR